MRVLRASLVLLILAAFAPAAAQADFGPAAPFQDTHPPVTTPSTTVSAGRLNANTSTVRITRAYADGRAPAQADVINTSTVGDVVQVLHNPARDALVVWTQQSGGTTLVRTAFWDADDAAPGPARETTIPVGGTVWNIGGALDASRSAVLVVGYTEQTWHSFSSDVASAIAAPTLLTTTPNTSGSGVAFTSATDGRFVIAFKQRVPASGPNPAYFKLVASTRASGHPLEPPVHVFGSPTRGVGFEAIKPAIAAGGRAMIAFLSTTRNTSKACPFVETDADRERAEVALSPVVGSTPAFVTQQVSAPNHNASALGQPAVGHGDRYAIRWDENPNQFCDPGGTVRINTAYTVPGQGMTTTGPPPSTLNGFWFQCDGDLYYKFTPTGGPAMGSVWKTGVPGSCDGTPPIGSGDPSTGTPGTTTGRPAGTPPPAPPPPPLSGPPAGGSTPHTPKIGTALRAARNGTVRMTVTSTLDGDFLIELLARRSGLLAAAAKPVRVGRYTRRAKAGVPITVTLKLTGAAKRTLGKKGKLRVLVRTTFTPSGGGKKVTGTKPVTFKRVNR